MLPAYIIESVEARLAGLRVLAHRTQVEAAGAADEALTYEQTIAKPARNIEFACASCGSPAVTVPTELTPAAPLQCARCGSVVGTWSDLQRLAFRMLPSGSTMSRSSSDPVPSRPEQVPAEQAQPSYNAGPQAPELYRRA
jgi:hypothetical protein